MATLCNIIYSQARAERLGIHDTYGFKKKQRNFLRSGYSIFRSVFEIAADKHPTQRENTAPQMYLPPRIFQNVDFVRFLHFPLCLHIIRRSGQKGGIRRKTQRKWIPGYKSDKIIPKRQFVVSMFEIVVREFFEHKRTGGYCQGSAVPEANGKTSISHQHKCIGIQLCRQTFLSCNSIIPRMLTVNSMTDRWFNQNDIHVVQQSIHRIPPPFLSQYLYYIRILRVCQYCFYIYTAYLHFFHTNINFFIFFINYLYFKAENTMIYL